MPLDRLAGLGDCVERPPDGVHFVRGEHAADDEVAVAVVAGNLFARQRCRVRRCVDHVTPPRCPRGRAARRLTNVAIVSAASAAAFCSGMTSTTPNGTWLDPARLMSFQSRGR